MLCSVIILFIRKDISSLFLSLLDGNIFPNVILYYRDINVLPYSLKLPISLDGNSLSIIPKCWNDLYE